MARNQFIIAIVAVVLGAAALIGIVVYNGTRTDTPQPLQADPTVSAGTAQLIRENSRYLDTAGDDAVTVVEFLDFECESCAAMYPYVEKMREKYDGKVNVVIRYFPIPSHRNSENAAIAVEAAAQQGQLEAMYERMYETQPQWGEKQDSKAALFRGFADDLGLDMTQFDAAVQDPATLDRVVSDRAEGTALGITQTPTFFVEGKKVDLQAVGDLEAAVEKAVAGD
jgi:protein-disulfide isomerase